MTIESTFLYSGLQNGIVYQLNTMGRPKAPANGNAYAGVPCYATKSYTPTLPKPRLVPHTGNDRLLKTQIFPGQEAATAQFSVGAEDMDLLSMLAGTTIKEVAGMRMLPHLTDLQGKETSVGVILYQAALSRLTSEQGYHFHFISKSKMVVTLPGAGNDPIDVVFDMTINPSENYLWGGALAPLADIYDPLSGVSETGAFEAGLFSGFSTYEPRLISFITQSQQTVFDIPASLKMADATKVAVFTAAPTDTHSELVDPADYTATTADITFDTTPGAGTEVHIVYQKA
jgi:hypothetical protein